MRLCLRQDAVDQIQELAFQIGVAHRALEAADHMVDLLRSVRPSLRTIVARTWSSAIAGSIVAVTRSRNATICVSLAFSSLKSRIPAAPRTIARAAAKYTLNLRLESGLGRFLAGELEDQRMHAEGDALDLIGGEPMLVAKLDAGVDRGMNDDAAGERFVGVQGIS